jgi:hypothetical protein
VDVAHLLTREKDPHEEDLRLKRNAHIKEKAVNAKLINIDAGAIKYPDGADRNAFLKPIRESVKKDAKLMRDKRTAWLAVDPKKRVGNEPPKPDENAMLKRSLEVMSAKSANAKAEITFSDFMSAKENKEEAETKFPSSFKTMKGGYSDIPQEAIPWAKGLTVGELQGEIAKYLAILTGRDPKALGPAIAKVLQVDIVKP